MRNVVTLTESHPEGDEHLEHAILISLMMWEDPS